MKIAGRNGSYSGGRSPVLAMTVAVLLITSLAEFAVAQLEGHY